MAEVTQFQTPIFHDARKITLEAGEEAIIQPTPHGSTPKWGDGGGTSWSVHRVGSSGTAAAAVHWHLGTAAQDPDDNYWAPHPDSPLGTELETGYIYGDDLAYARLRIQNTGTGTAPDIVVFIGSNVPLNVATGDT